MSISATLAEGIDEDIQRDILVLGLGVDLDLVDALLWPPKAAEPSFTNRYYTPKRYDPIMIDRQRLRR